MFKIVVYSPKGGDGKSTLVPSLADVLKEVQVVDLDPQQTLSNASKITGRHVPIGSSEVSAKFVVYDTPPYRDIKLRDTLRHADLIILPTMIGYSNLIALSNALDELKKIKALDKSVVVFNKVKRPYNRAYHDIKGFFKQNYPLLKVAQQELGQLKSYQEVLVKPLEGKALKEMLSLVEELGIIS